MSLYDNVESLIRDNNRFSIKNLMAYTPSEWPSKHNQVIVKFVETLIQNGDVNTAMSQEKLFKPAAVINSIWRTTRKICISCHFSY